MLNNLGLIASLRIRIDDRRVGARWGGGTPLGKFKEPVCSFSRLSIKGTAFVSRSKVIICLDLRPRFSSLLPHLGSTSWQPRRAWLAPNLNSSTSCQGSSQNCCPQLPRASLGWSPKTSSKQDWGFRGLHPKPCTEGGSRASVSRVSIFVATRLLNQAASQHGGQLCTG